MFATRKQIMEGWTAFATNISRLPRLLASAHCARRDCWWCSLQNRNVLRIWWL